MTASEIAAQVAALMNDTQQRVYTSVACLPYINIALQDLQEIFEQNNVPYTNASSEPITVPAGTTVIGRLGSPQLPSGLLEVRQLWERQSGIDPYIPMQRMEFLPHDFQDGIQISQFLVWAWINDAIHVLSASQDIDLKIDGLYSMFNLPITSDRLDEDLPFYNCSQYLAFRAAFLCSQYIGENQSRAQMLATDAQLSIDRVLAIHSKSKQAINIRKRPFRAGYKNRGGWYV